MIKEHTNDKRQIVLSAVVVVQLVEWFLPTPEIFNSNPIIALNCIEKTIIKKNRPGIV